MSNLILGIALSAFALGDLAFNLWLTTVIIQEWRKFGASFGGWCAGLAIIGLSVGTTTLILYGVLQTI